MRQNKTDAQLLVKIPKELKKKFRTVAIDRDITIREATYQAIELWITNRGYETKQEKALDTMKEET